MENEREEANVRERETRVPISFRRRWRLPPVLSSPRRRPSSSSPRRKRRSPRISSHPYFSSLPLPHPRLPLSLSLSDLLPFPFSLDRLLCLPRRASASHDLRVFLFLLFANNVDFETCLSAVPSGPRFFSSCWMTHSLFLRCSFCLFLPSLVSRGPKFDPFANSFLFSLDPPPRLFLLLLLLCQARDF